MTETMRTPFRWMVAILFPLALLTARAADKPAEGVKTGVAGGATEIAQGPEVTGVSNVVYLVSWGDLIFFYGPETDPGLNTKEQIARIIPEWKRRGCTHVFWRTERENPLLRWNTSTIYAEGSFIKADGERINARIDPTEVARDAAHKNGMKFYIWHSLFDDGTPADKVHRHWKQGFPWRNTFFDEHPELEVRDRKGGVQWGIREMAYPLARRQKIDEYLDLVRKYKPDGVFFYLHSHSAPGFHGDQYGFNAPIVEEYQKRYGINLLTDPRFDYENPAYNPKDEMVEKWRALRGEYLTAFFREAKAALRKEKPDLALAINTQGGDWFGPPFGNMKMEWRTWIREGLADMLLLRTWMAGGCGAYNFSKEGYLTWADGGFGVTPYPEVRAEVEKSGNKILVVSRERRPLEGTDGYFDASARLDLPYARKQRAGQLQANMKKDGVIHFIRQDFEDCRPLEKKGYLDFTFGGKRFFTGDSRYFASRNTSPGFAGPISEDPAMSPTLVDLSSTGRKGWGIRLADRKVPLTLHRRTGDDWPDDPIGVGKASARVDILRTTGASLLVGLGRRNGQIPEHPQVRLDETGAVSVLEGGKWVATGGALADGAWGALRFDVSFEAKTWTLSLDGKPLATRPLDSAKAAFDALLFSVAGEAAYVDNVRVDWIWRETAATP